MLLIPPVVASTEASQLVSLVDFAPLLRWWRWGVQASYGLGPPVGKIGQFVVAYIPQKVPAPWRTLVRYFYLESSHGDYLPGVDRPPDNWNIILPETAVPGSPVMQPPTEFGFGSPQGELTRKLTHALAEHRKQTQAHCERCGITWTPSREIWRPDDLSSY